MLTPIPASRAGRGVTLIELLVAVAIIALSATLAAPDIATMVASYKVRTAAESLLNGLNYARAEAIRRNSAVTFALAPTGWSVAQVSPATNLQTHASSDAVAVTSDNAASAVTFLPTGLVQAGTQLRQLTVASTVDAANTRRINVFGGGLIRMCDPGVTAAGDPRSC